MGLPETIAIGIDTLQDLFGAFSDQVMGRGIDNYDVSKLRNIDCWMFPEDRKSRFFLNPYEDHVCAGSDWVVWVILACIIHVLSWSGRWFIYEPLADARMKGKSPTWDHKACQKFSETMTCNVFFIISASLGCRVIWPKHWSTSSVAWTDNIDDWSLPGDYKFFYILYGARFTSDLISIFFENRPRGTFLLSFAHHVVTISLVLLTATANFTEFAGVVMFYFDWADPLLLSAKACRYMSLESDGLLNTISDRLFELFAVVFIFTRGVIYNFIVYVACRDGPQTPLGIGGKALLIILAFMQTYWIGLIIKAALIKKTTGKLEDIQNKEKKET